MVERSSWGAKVIDILFHQKWHSSPSSSQSSFFLVCSCFHAWIVLKVAISFFFFPCFCLGSDELCDLEYDFLGCVWWLWEKIYSADFWNFSFRKSFSLIIFSLHIKHPLILCDDTWKYYGDLMACNVIGATLSLSRPIRLLPSVACSYG